MSNDMNFSDEEDFKFFNGAELIIPDEERRVNTLFRFHSGYGATNVMIEKETYDVVNKKLLFNNIEIYKFGGDGGKVNHELNKLLKNDETLDS